MNATLFIKKPNRNLERIRINEFFFTLHLKMTQYGPFPTSLNTKDSTHKQSLKIFLIEKISYFDIII